MTPVVIDLAHCGTTMLAQCLERLGVPMIVGGDRGHHEDAEIALALRGRQRFEATVQKRNGQLWGFKHPGAWRFAHWFGCLDDPTYFVIYKEPVSVAWRMYEQIDAPQVLSSIGRLQRSVEGIIASELSPVYWMSYLEAVRDSPAFVRRLAAICQVDASPEQIGQAAAWIRLDGNG